VKVLAQFTLLDKRMAEYYIKPMFDILYENMSVIAPTGNGYEKDFGLWSQTMSQNLLNENRNIILIHEDYFLVGFFMYSVANKNVLKMEEIQILPDYRNKNNIFRQLHDFLIPLLPHDIKIVDAYAHKLNRKSQGILGHLGLRRVGENKNYIHFQGKYEKLLDWYNGK
jgi:hypothetical protein